MPLEPKIPLPFTNGFYQSRSKPLSSQECVGWYVNVNEADALSPENLFTCQGIELSDEAPDPGVGVPAEVNRGSHTMDSVPYFVNGGFLDRYDRSVDGAGVETLTRVRIGAISGEGRVSMDDNGNELCIVVPGGDAFIYTQPPTDTLVTITDIDFDGPTETVVYINGYFVFNKTDSQKIFHSNLNQGTVYDALDFGTAEADPDNIIALHVYRNQLYALGSQTIQPFNNIGGSGFVFAAVPNGVVDIGLRSTFAITNYVDSFVFLGKGEDQELGIYRYAGALQKLSTTPIDFVLQNTNPDLIDDAFLLYLSKDGAEFSYITFSNKTFGFDLTATNLAGRKIWHQRESRIDDEDEQWRVKSLTSAYNRVFCGDSMDSRIGVIESEIYQEYGEHIIRRISGQPFESNGKAVRTANIEASVDVGHGTATTELQLGLDWSDDGGFTYSNKLYRGLGFVGEYTRRPMWRRINRFPYTRIVRFHFSDNGPCSFNRLMSNSR
jgi:hypothetical protein